MSDIKRLLDQWRAMSPREQKNIILKIARDARPDMQRGQKRQARLKAYRRRRQWATADEIRLLEIGVNEAAQKRLVRLRKKPKPGPGVVRPLDPLDIALQRRIRAFASLAPIYDPTTPERERRALLKRTSWWALFIEAAYETERQRAKGSRKNPGVSDIGHEEPSEIAERLVAKAADISPGEVHRLSRKARTQRKQNGMPLANMSAAELKKLLRTGMFPEMG